MFLFKIKKKVPLGLLIMVHCLFAAPVVEITFPTDGYKTTNWIINVDWEVNGDKKNYETEQQLNEGKNWIIRQVEEEGEVYSDSVLVIKECILCLLLIHNPQDKSSINDSSIGVVWSVDGNIQTIHNRQDLNYGENEITRGIEDQNGDSILITHKVYRDTSPPEINPIVNQFSWLNDSTAYMGPYIVKDDYKLSEVYLFLTQFLEDTVKIDSFKVFQVSIADTFGVEIPLDSNVNYEIQLTAEDAAGNKFILNDFNSPIIDTSQVFHFIHVDSSFAIIDSIFIIDSSEIKKVGIVLNPNVSDTFLIKDNLKFEGNKWSYHFDYLPGDTAYFKIEVEDIFGNKSDWYSFFLINDQKPPVFEIKDSMFFQGEDSISLVTLNIEDNVANPPYFVVYTQHITFPYKQTIIIKDTITSFDNIKKPSFFFPQNYSGYIDIDIQDKNGASGKQTIPLESRYNFKQSDVTKGKKIWHLLGFPFSLKYSDFSKYLSQNDAEYTLDNIDSVTFFSFKPGSNDSIPGRTGLLFGSFESDLILPDTYIPPGPPDTILNLDSGWNIVASPFPHEVNFQIVSTSDDKPVLFELKYDPTDGKSEYFWSIDVKEIKPYIGYILFANQTDQIIFKAKPAPTKRAPKNESLILKESYSGSQILFSNQFRTAPHLNTPGSNSNFYSIIRGKKWMVQKFHPNFSQLLVFETEINSRVNFELNNPKDTAVLLDAKGKDHLNQQTNLPKGTHVYTFVSGTKEYIRSYHGINNLNFSPQFFGNRSFNRINYLLPNHAELPLSSQITLTNLSGHIVWNKQIHFSQLKGMLEPDIFLPRGLYILKFKSLNNKHKGSFKIFLKGKND